MDTRWNCSYRLRGRKEKTLYLAVWILLVWNQSGRVGRASGPRTQVQGHQSGKALLGAARGHSGLSHGACDKHRLQASTGGCPAGRQGLRARIPGAQSLYDWRPPGDTEPRGLDPRISQEEAPKGGRVELGWIYGPSGTVHFGLSECAGQCQGKAAPRAGIW